MTNPLHEAIASCDLDRVEAILAETPGLIHERAEDGDTVAHLACSSGSMEILTRVLAAGAEVDGLGSCGWTPLYQVCIGYSCLAPILLDAGADVNGKNGCIPLHAAAMFIGPELIDYLLERGADIDAENDVGYTALHAAYDDHHPRSARHLWNRGARGDVYGAALAKMAFLRAVIASDSRIIHARDGHNRTMLHWACRGCQPYVARFLLDLGGNPNARNYSGYTPLHEAISHSAPDSLLACLIEFGADVNQPDIAGRTPLHLAAGRAGVATVRRLLRAGARLDSKDCDGLTPYDHAAKRGRSEIAAALWFRRASRSGMG